MNNGYYQNGINIPTQNGYPNQAYAPNTLATEFPMEQSYVENILRLNKGKYGRFYTSFPDSNVWKDKVFTGVVEQAGRDHLIISDPSTGKWYLILMIYLNYVEFEEKINYSPDFTLKAL